MDGRFNVRSYFGRGDELMHIMVMTDFDLSQTRFREYSRPLDEVPTASLAQAGPQAEALVRCLLVMRGVDKICLRPLSIDVAISPVLSQEHQDAVAKTLVDMLNEIYKLVPPVRKVISVR